MSFSRWLSTLFVPNTRRHIAPLRRPIVALEDRIVPAVYRPIDGVGTNVAHPAWGATNVDLIRLSAAAYTDGSTPTGSTRPSARAISNVVVSHPADDIKNDRLMSNFVYAWGQFIDHDLDLVNSASPGQSFNVAVPTGDPSFDPTLTGTQVIPLSRSAYDSTTGTSATNPRQQVNSITAFLDGSMVYGSDAARAAALRTGRGGLLKTSTGNMLPYNTAGLANANDTHQYPADQLYVAGDIRANENIELTAIQTLFVREHNRIAARIAQQTPGLSDEEIYQRARRIVIGEIQTITYNEFLPALLGPNALRPYTGYNPNVNPGISNEFAAAAFRFGHSMLGDDVEFLNDQGVEVHDAVALKDALFNPGLIGATGIDPILKYLASDKAEEIDTRVVDSLRNFLFGSPGQGGLDLASLNIQRGRDHGLADYNTIRASVGLPRVTSFAQITSNVALQRQLQSLYGNVNNIDVWVGGLAEDHIAGGSLGPTFARIVADQFMRLRDGDRFWYQRDLTGPDLATVSQTTLASVTKNNTTLRNLQDNVFFFKASITGQVFADANRDGRSNPGERGVSGRVMQLLAEDGSVVATTVTTTDGGYRFDGLDLGTYTVREVLPAGVVRTTSATRTVQITRGQTIDRQDFGEATPPRPALPPQLGGPGHKATAAVVFLGDDPTNDTIFI
ncbi:MAG: peroxidase family protein [Gemmataceae bacterium]